MFRSWRNRFRKRREAARAYWNRTLQGRSVIACKDFWHDFKHTLKEVTGEDLPVQYLAATCILIWAVMVNFVTWVIASFPMALVLWWIWNAYLIHIFPEFFTAQVTFMEAWSLCLLVNFLGFRSIKIELIRMDKPE